MNKQFTITVLTGNQIGLLNRVTGIFSRRQINIESITVCESEDAGVHRYTIVIAMSEEEVNKIVKQIEKQVDVISVECQCNEHAIHQEMALYKVPNSILTFGGEGETVLRRYNARILSVENDFTIVEKTGSRSEIQDLFESLRMCGAVEFVRSGKVVIARPMITENLEQIVA